MEYELLVALLAGLGSMIGWGVADFFAKKTIDKIGDVATLFWAQLIGVFPLLILFLVRPSLPSIGYVGFAYLAFLGIWEGLTYIPVYVAFGKGKVSLLSPIFATYAIVVAILSAVFFGEIIPFGRQISFVIVFLGIVLINNGNPKSIWLALQGKEYKKTEKIKGLKEIIFAICFYGLWLIFFDRFVAGRYWVPFLLGVRIFSTLTVYVYAKRKHIKLTILDRGLWKFLVLIGLFDVAAFASLSYGFSQSSYVSIVAMLGAIFSLPTIILARIFLKEKVTTIQTIGSIVIIVGILFLFLF